MFVKIPLFLHFPLKIYDEIFTSDNCPYNISFSGPTEYGSLLVHALCTHIE